MKENRKHNKDSYANWLVKVRVKPVLLKTLLSCPGADGLSTTVFKDTTTVVPRSSTTTQGIGVPISALNPLDRLEHNDGIRHWCLKCGMLCGSGNDYCLENSRGTVSGMKKM